MQLTVTDCRVPRLTFPSKIETSDSVMLRSVKATHYVYFTNFETAAMFNDDKLQVNLRVRVKDCFM